MSSTNFQVGLSENMKNSSKVLKPPGGGSSDLFGNPEHGPTTPRSFKNHMKSNIFAAPEPVNRNGDVRRPQADSFNRLFGESDRLNTPAKNRLRSNIPIGGPTDQTDAVKQNDSDQNSTSTSSSNAIFEYKNIKNPTFNSNIKLFINDDFISVTDNSFVNHETSSIKSDGNSIPMPPSSPRRDPVTGFGIESNNQRPRKMGGQRGGNPVTGDGYRSVNRSTSNGSSNGEINTNVPSLNGNANSAAKQNRIPPGGYSSGLW